MSIASSCGSLPRVYFRLASAFILLACGSGLPAGEFALGTFDDNTELKRWSLPSTDEIRCEIAPNSATDKNKGLKAVFMAGNWPGFVCQEVPRDWGPYETLRFRVSSITESEITVRLDDESSKDHPTRFHENFHVMPGENLFQVSLKNVAGKLDIRRMKRAVFFVSDPPRGLTLFFDDFILGDSAESVVPFIPYRDRKDLLSSAEHVTPHIPFARPLSGGPLRIFALTYIRYGRELAELGERIEIEASSVSWDPSWDINTWGIGDFYGQRGHKNSFELVKRYLASSLEGPEKFDTMLLPMPMGWVSLSKAARRSLIERVRSGAGLVLIHPFSGREEDKTGDQGADACKDLWELSPLVRCASDYARPPWGYRHMDYKAPHRKGGAWKAAGAHYLSAGVPLDTLPTAGIITMDYSLGDKARVVIEDDKGRPIAAVKEFGKGRVAAFAWRELNFTPEVEHVGAKPPCRWPYWETGFSLIARSLLWTAKRDRPPLLASARCRQSDSGAGQKVDILVPSGLKLSVAFRDSDGRSVTPSKQGGESTEGGMRVLPANFNGKDALVSGRIFADIQALDDGGRVLDWATLSWEHAAPSGPRLSVEAAGNIAFGGDLSVKPVVEGAVPAKARLYAELVDTRGRVFARHSFANGEKLAIFSRVRPMTTLIKARLRLESPEGSLLSEAASEVLVTPGSRAWDDWQVALWPVERLPYLRDHDARLMEEWGATSSFFTEWRNESETRLYVRNNLSITAHDVARRGLHVPDYVFDKQKADFDASGDIRFLIRQPCLADPAWREETRQALNKELAMISRYRPLAYPLADEPSLTNYRKELDLCFHPASLAGFRSWMRKRYGDIKEANRCLGTDYASFDAITPPTAREAREKNQWPCWSEFRAYMDEQFAETQLWLKGLIRARDPGARIAVSGTQAPSPFDGFDWEKLMPVYDCLIGYSYGSQDLMHQSFASGRVPMFNATGYGLSGPALAYQQWQRLINGAGGMGIFWWVAVSNPDFTLSASGRDMQALNAEFSSGIARVFMESAKTWDQVAVLYSMASVRAAWMEGRQVELESRLETCFEALAQAGFTARFMSEAQVLALEPAKRGIRLIILPLCLSLDVKTAESLRRFAKNGGVVADLSGQAGRYDGVLRPRGAFPLIPEGVKPEIAKTGRLFRIGTGALLLPAEGIKENNNALACLNAGLQSARLRPTVQVKRRDGSTVSDLEITVHALDGARIISILRKPARTKCVVGADGVVGYEPAGGGGEEKEILAVSSDILRDSFIQDMRQGLAPSRKTSGVEVENLHGQATLLACLPYKVTAIEVTGPKKVIAGQSIAFQARIIPDAKDSGSMGRHVVHMEAFAPDGRKIRWYGGNHVLSSGKGEIVMESALNDLTGSWRFVFNDVISSAKTEIRVEIVK